MNYEIKEEQKKSLKEDDFHKKCYPTRASNQMPYQKIEIEIRKDAHWPPITTEVKDETKVNVLDDKTSNEIEQEVAANEKPQTSEILAQINENCLNESQKKRQRFDDKNLETSF